MFERAVSVRKSCSLLWRMFFYYEVSQERESQAKDVYYRSIKSCPFEKNLFILGLNHFPQLFQETIDVMTEKEIRIRTLPEEIKLLIENISLIGPQVA